MLREEKFALRPLGLLKALGRGETPSDLAEAARMVQGLKNEIAQMEEDVFYPAALLIGEYAARVRKD